MNSSSLRQGRSEAEKRKQRLADVKAVVCLKVSFIARLLRAFFSSTFPFLTEIWNALRKNMR